MQFSALKTELAARGFDYLSDSRLGFFVNSAVHEIDSLALWPYRLATGTTAGWSTGTITLTNADRVVAVAISNDGGSTFLELSPRTTEELNTWEDLTAGTPQYYAATFSASGLALDVFPKSGTWTVKAVYYQHFADLSGDTDTPALPDRYHSLIVDVAARMAYLDNDDFEAAGALEAHIERDLRRLHVAMDMPQLPVPPEAHQ
jgi:hypothetical protein